MKYKTSELIRAITRSVQDLHQGIDTHRCLIESLVAKNSNDTNLQMLIDVCPAKSREDKLRGALKEAIDVLEESRKAFKSKQLERLRKKLTQVLIDTP